MARRKVHHGRSYSRIIVSNQLFYHFITIVFKITEEMQKWRAKNFNNAGPAGESYRTNDDAFRKTIISRFVGGDSNVPPITSELKKIIHSIIITLCFILNRLGILYREKHIRSI